MLFLLIKTPRTYQLFSRKSIIPIASSFDNSYADQALVSFTSVCINSDNNTFYEIYFLVPGDFTEKNKEILKTIVSNYPTKCNINFINMENKFDGFYTTAHFSKSAYYFLYVPEIFKQYKKMIWLESDTITLADLKELFNLPMKGNFLLGHIDPQINELSMYGIKSNLYINGGVILMNLDELRKMEFTKKSLDVIKRFKVFKYLQQSVINIVLAGKLGALPAKYGIHGGFKSKQTTFMIIEQIKGYDKDNLTYEPKEYLDAYDNPSIIHYCDIKPWKNNYDAANYLYYFIYYTIKTNYGELLIQKWYNKKIINIEKSILPIQHL